jgi:maleylacetoacetate isomerase
MPTVLHDYFRSSACYRVRIGLNLKGIAYTPHTVSLAANDQQSAGYRALNPQGFVPMLEIDGLRLTQSLAILAYLDTTHPDPAFVPRDPAAAAHVQALALTVACDIHPLNNLRVLRYLKDPLGHDQPTIDTWYRQWIDDGLSAMETLAAPAAGTFLFGDSPTLADICLVPQLANARRFDARLDAFPTLLRAEAAATALPAFAAAHPDRVQPQE